MPEMLIAYASTHGHTARVAARVAEVARDADLIVDLADLGHGGEPDPWAYDVVVVGASVHAGHHQREVARWLRRRATRLNAMPSALFSVSLNAAEDSDEGREAARGYVDDLLDDTGWQPRRVARVAGAVQYLEYDPVTRLLIRLMMARGGHPTDTSHDHEYTDWEAVDAFARECAALVDTPRAALR